MTDRELLELAAQAAGYQWSARVAEERKALGLDALWITNPPECLHTAWNPLESDGEALRLAVKLKIDLRFPQDNDMYVDAGNCDGYTVYLIDEGGDRAAATRRAIVRAAAEIGRTK